MAPRAAAVATAIADQNYEHDDVHHSEQEEEKVLGKSSGVSNKVHIPGPAWAGPEPVGNLIWVKAVTSDKDSEVCYCLGYQHLELLVLCLLWAIRAPLGHATKYEKLQSFKYRVAAKEQEQVAPDVIRDVLTVRFWWDYGDQSYAM